MKRLRLDTVTIEYERIAPRPRQVRVILRMDGDHLQVSAPKHVTTNTIEDVIRRHESWVQAQLAKHHEGIRRPLQLGDKIWFRGDHVPLICASDSDGTGLGIEYDADKGQVIIPSEWDATTMHEGVYRWIRKQANEQLTEQICNTAARHHLNPRRISIKEQKRRWGSCTSQGTIHLNWRLIQAPPIVATYVVIHELAHLKEMNHGPQFWSLVRQMMPEYDIHRHWLREHGQTLYHLQEHVMQFDPA